MLTSNVPELPNTIGELKNLEKLDLGYCQSLTGMWELELFDRIRNTPTNIECSRTPEYYRRTPEARETGLLLLLKPHRYVGIRNYLIESIIRA